MTGGDSAEQLRARVDSLNEAASSLLKTDDRQVLELAGTAARLSREHGYAPGLARAKLIEGHAYVGQGDSDHALPCLQAALETFRELGDPGGQCNALESLGRLYLQIGEMPTAEEHLEAALALSRDCKDQATEATVLNLLGGVYHRNGAYMRSLDCLHEALRLHHETGNRVGEASLSANIGVLYISLGQYPEALDHLTKAYALLQNGGHDERTKGNVLINLGHLYLNMSKPQSALPYLEEALQIVRTQQDRLREAIVTCNIGTARAQTQQEREAEIAFREALTLFKEVQSRQGEANALNGLGGLLARRGDGRAAAEAHAEAVRIAQEIEDLEVELDALLHLGQVQADLGELPAALTTLQRALTLAGEAEHKKTVSDTHRALSQVYRQAGDFERALHHHELYHDAERALFNEESDKKTRELSARFDVERARHEAEVERVQREAAETARGQAEALVSERTRELEQAQVEIVTRLAVAAEYRDDLTGEHTWRVGHVSALIARELGLPEEDVSLLRIAARLHDVGKIGIPDAILLKPGRFTPEEFERMKAHPFIGAHILSGGQSRLLRMAEEIALSHHERWDGTGYPLGKRGRSIPITGRIVAVADVFDALTSERPYKKAWAHQEALEELRRGAGSQFDPEVVEAGLRVFTRRDFAALMRPEGTPPPPTLRAVLATEAWPPVISPAP
nr:tetratricopeptide repeat protein [Deinococcus metallilatus]